MNILIVGSGAREHAIAAALMRSAQTPAIFCFGTNRNPGVMHVSTDYVTGDITDVAAIIQQAKIWQINLAIIGPEAPLEKGLADALWLNGIPTIGPTQKLAQIETSKAFARDLLKKYGVPGSPAYQVFKSLAGVGDFLHQLGENNYVVKANGLQGGKGVKVAGDHLHSIKEAYQFCETLVNSKQTFVIEEKLVGQEFSLLCFTDGNALVMMPAVQDHKRAYVGNKGANTGGMGSYTDANHRLPFLTGKEIAEACQINKLALNALQAEVGERYVGVLYGSFIATQHGVKTIEFNARFGDPEALNLLTILQSDFLTICQSMVAETLSDTAVRFAPLATVCKYAVPNGYPDQPEKNILINIDAIQNPDNLYLGAVTEKAGKLYATGSRTAAVVGVATNISAAEEIAEAEVNRIEGALFHREDIGKAVLINQCIEQMQILRQRTEVVA